MKNVKTMYRKLTMMVVLGVLLAVMSCNNLLTPPKGNSTDRDSGSGNVSEDGKVLITIKLFTGSARTVMPEMDLLTWHITAKQGTDNIEATGTYPTYTLELPTTGPWTFTVKGTKENKELFTGTATENVSNSTTSISIPLSPGSGMTDGGATGTLSLPIELINVCYMNLTYRINDGEWVKVEFDGSGKVSIFKNYLSVGQHTLDLYFGGGSKFYFCTVAVNIWPGMTSDQWIKTNGEEYIDDNGEFVITEEMVNKFVKTMGSVVFVDASVNADEPGTGSIFAPVNSVSTAVDILRQANEGNTQINGTIMVSGATTIDQEIEVQTNETLTVKGTGASITNTTGRVFNITGGSLTLGENITLTGTVTDDNGGAVYVAGGNFIMEGNSIITGSSATGTTASGGAVYVAGGSFTMSDTATIQGNTATTHGGGVHILSGGTFTMNGGTIDGTIGGTAANTAENGGGVFVSGGTFNMNGGTISGNTVTQSGGGVCISGGTFTMSDGAVISGNTATSSGGGVFVSEGGKFTMEGGTIGETGGGSSNSAENGGGVYIHNGTFTMSDSAVINGNKASSISSSGGGVYIHNGTFTMSDSAVISGNTATSSGGGVYVSTDGTFTMEGGTIGGTGVASPNSSESGGGVCVYRGDFTMSDGSISGNKVTQSGGGVFVQDGTFTMEGGTIGGAIANIATQNGGGIYLDSTGGTVTLNNTSSISGNVATDKGGGVYVADGTFTVSGSSLTITGNTAHNVYLANGKTISIGDGGFTGGTIGVTAEEMKAGSAVQITDTDVPGAGDRFDSDISAYSIEETIATTDGGIAVFLSDAEVAYKTSSSAKGKTLGSFAEAYEGKVTEITLLKDITPTTVSGFSWPIVFDWICTLDLNGHAINREQDREINEGQVIKIFSPGNLTIKDSSANADGTGGTGKITGGFNDGDQDNGGGGIYVESGSLTLESGSITGNKTLKDGGGVYIGSGCTFTMKGGSITDNTANDGGGGICVAGTFTMENGSITNNRSEQGNGGGVNIGSYGNFTMTGGTIGGTEPNTAVLGGGVYVSGTSNFTLGILETPSSPVVSGNTKTGSSPNNVYLDTGKTLFINGILKKTEVSGNIGITMSIPGEEFEFTSGWSDSGLPDSTFFFSDDTQYKVEVNDNGELQLINK